MSDERDYLWDPTHEPDPDVVALEQAVRGVRFDGRPLAPLPAATPQRRVYVRHVLLAVAAVIVAAVGATWTIWRASFPTPWSVETLAGAPTIARGAGTNDRVGVGGRIETDQRSTARIAIGSVGVADVGPDSRVSVLRTDGGENRLALQRGTLYVSVWARPRFFVVETPSATAVDLGCVYTLTVDTTGVGVLAVSVGEVELESQGRSTLVPAGTAARLYPGQQVGLPVPIAASDAFKLAARLADRGSPSDSVLDVLVREATVQGTITLWHLLARESGARRHRLYDRVASLVPPPAGITRDAVIVLEPKALAEWEERLRPLWNSEPSSQLRRLLVRFGVVKPALQLSVRRSITDL